MKQQKLAAINEMTSPLFRIMSIHNDQEPNRRTYDNNISAFHIGNGYLLSVAHALRAEMAVIRSISEDKYKAQILPHLSTAEKQQLDQWYFFDSYTGKRYLNMPDQNEFPQLVEIFKRINYDTRVTTLYQNKICKPYLIIQQRTGQFYNNPSVHAQFHPSFSILDPNSQRHTYLLETELVETFMKDDIALYKIINTHPGIIDLIPKFEMDDEVYDVANKDFYCLQSAPSDLTPGRMINEANIEGLIDQWISQQDRIGGNYIFEGLRYLIKGYFRFGSSGAPYLKFDPASNSFKVNAIQSEACPIQLTIHNDKKGNFQWINAIATPISNVAEKIREQMNKTV